MAHAITLTDGTTTVNLYDIAAVCITEWLPTTAENDEQTVGESMQLYVTGASITARQNSVRAIERLLDIAQRRAQRRTGPRVYLTVQWDGESSAWRSEVLAGRLEMGGTSDQYSRGTIEGELGITRVPYWEGPEAPLPITNGNGVWDGVTNTTPLTVFNCNDGTGTSPNKRHNYVQIAAADVTGSLPAPVKLEMKNNEGMAADWYRFYLANNAESDPANFPTLIEAEAQVSGGVDTANPTYCSGGYCIRFDTYSTAQATWSLSTTLLQKAAGRWFRLLGRFQYRTTTTVLETAQISICAPGGITVLWRGPAVKINETSIAHRPLVDLGTFPLPPGGYDSSWAALVLRLDLTVASGTGITDLDCFYILATDSYQTLELKPISAANGDIVMNNGIDGIAYLESSGVRYPYVTPVGAPLVVFPNKLQRISIMADTPNGVPDIANKWLVRAYYRPRRLTL